MRKILLVDPQSETETWLKARLAVDPSPGPISIRRVGPESDSLGIARDWMPDCVFFVFDSLQESSLAVLKEWVEDPAFVHSGFLLVSDRSNEKLLNDAQSLGAHFYLIRSEDVSALEVRNAIRVAVKLAALSAREARATTRSQDEFLSIAAHELKTPLTAIKLKLQYGMKFLTRESDGNTLLPAWKKLLVETDRQMDRMTRLVDNLLDLSRLQADRLTLQIEEVDLSELARDVVERASGQLAHAHCPVDLRIDSGVMGFWDGVRIDQILTNLLANVVRYAPSSVVEVGVVPRDQEVQFWVKDFGPGIDLEDQQKIFKRFEKTSRAASSSGLGLGLYIAREIVEAHGGRIEVESEVGSGATFFVTLPRDSRPMAAARGVR